MKLEDARYGKIVKSQESFLLMKSFFPIEKKIHFNGLHGAKILPGRFKRDTHFPSPAFELFK